MKYKTLSKIKSQIAGPVNGVAVFAFRPWLLASLLLLVGLNFKAQQITVGAYTACPNQVVTVNISWSNVGNVTYSLTSPVGAQPGNMNLGSATSFTISNVTQGPVNYTISGVGTGSNGVTTSTVPFVLNVLPPPILSVTNNTHYCVGNTATFVVPPQLGAYYQVLGAPGSPTFASNIINFGPLTAQNSGNYTVVSVGACTMQGTTLISMAPNTPLSINGASNVCQNYSPATPNSSFALTAALPTATNFVWSKQNVVLPNGNTPAVLFAAAQPTDSGVYQVYAELPWGAIFCPRTATTQIDVVPTSPISINASPSNVVCQGDKITLNASAGSNPVGWAWTGPQSFLASVSNPTVNPALPTNAGIYSVTALFSNNIITCSQTQTVGVQVVTVNQPVISMPTSVCQGASVPVSATAPGSTGYSWQGPGFPSATTTGNGSVSAVSIPNAQPNASGIYYVTATFQLLATSCVATSSAQLNVVPVNSITIIPTAPVCDSKNADLQCTATGANVYTWVGPNGFASPGPNATVFYPKPNASGVYTVTAYFTGANLTCSNTATTSLVVNPVLNFSLVPRQQMCYNTQVSVIGPTGATGYSWTASNGFKANTKDINFASVQPPNSGNYTLQVSLGPCITSASTTIDVLTPLQFSLIPQPRELCSGDTTVFEVGATGGSQNYAYTWNPAVYFDNPVGPKKTAVPKSTILYNVVAHDIACPHYTIGYTFPVTVNQAPVPDLKLPRTSGCVPLSLYYDSGLSDDVSPITTFDFGGLRKRQGNAFPYTLDVPGTYTLSIYTIAKITGCKGRYDYPSPLVVYPKPGASISWNPEIPTTTDEITFYPSIANGEIVSRLWTFSGGLPSVIDTTIDFTVPGSDTSNVQYPTRRYEQIGKYPVMLVVKNDKDCVDSIVRFMPVIDDFRLFIPNTFTPNDDGNNDVFNVKGTGMRTDGFSMEITDRWGGVVFFTKDITQGWDGKNNGKTVPNGTFFYKVKAVGQNGEGRREFTGYVTVIK